MVEIETDICVIGAGSGGLSVAAAASMMGAPTVLIEAAKMGGDCLNTGCVPSKSLLAAGHAAQAMRESARFGVNGAVPGIDFTKVHSHVHDVIAAIAPNDSVERFEGLGVRVIEAHGRFTAPNRVEAGGQVIRARRFVVATGSRAAVPPIPGLDETPFMTNETLFDQTTAPEHLIIIGGGPIGVELAQAHRRLGSEVTLLEMFSLLGNDDPELVDVVRNRLRAEGVEIHEGLSISGVERQGNRIVVTAGSRIIEGSHLLVAAGRAPNVDDLGLDAGRIEHSAKGIAVDARMRTSNRRVYAVGDVTGPPMLTHAANLQAGIVIRNALFRLPAKLDTNAMPWVTYSDPELAQVGMNEAAARAAGRAFRVLRWPFAENDRAQAERATEGLIKAIVTPRGAILGAGIVGRAAGELIQPWALAIGAGLKIGALAGMTVAYPTLGEVNKRAAGAFFTPKLTGEGVKKLVKFLSWFG
jgi:pyruvate/2-oxoglutarate dehydrogenase complex dihydrolipoamide dehydrogenase (E3) component